MWNFDEDTGVKRVENSGRSYAAGFSIWFSSALLLGKGEPLGC
jgi:hypothetical protein